MQRADPAFLLTFGEGLSTRSVNVGNVFVCVCVRRVEVRVCYVVLRFRGHPAYHERAVPVSAGQQER